jgi:hypothetical protein
LSEENTAPPNRWRILAAEAREAAARVSNKDAIHVLLRIAESYDNLAERAEKASAVDKGHRK